MQAGRLPSPRHDSDLTPESEVEDIAALQAENSGYVNLGSGPSTGEPSPKKTTAPELGFQAAHRNPQDIEKPDMAERDSISKLEKELQESERQHAITQAEIAKQNELRHQLTKNENDPRLRDCITKICELDGIAIMLDQKNKILHQKLNQLRGECVATLKKQPLGFANDVDNYLNDPSQIDEQKQVQPPVEQDPDYFYAAYHEDQDMVVDVPDGIDISQRNIDRLLSEIAFYRHKVKLLVGHGYHVVERAQHNDGIHHQEFVEARRKLEHALFEYVKVTSHIQQLQKQQAQAIEVQDLEKSDQNVQPRD